MRNWINLFEGEKDILAITHAMRDRLVREYNRPPREINSGNCMDFSDALETEYPDLFSSMELGNLHNHCWENGEDSGDATGFDVAMIERQFPNWKPPADFTWEQAFSECGLNWTGTHMWAYCNKNRLCYDIENVSGVENVFDLEFFKRIFEHFRQQRIAPTYTLFHGTCSDEMCRTGWKPNQVTAGANQGQSRYLYLTNHPDNAKWFADQKGCSTILVVKNVPAEFLRVDPEDGRADTVKDELNFEHKLPGSVVLTQPLGPEHFEVYHA